MSTTSTKAYDAVQDMEAIFTEPHDDTMYAAYAVRALVHQVILLREDLEAVNLHLPFVSNNLDDIRRKMP